MRMPARNRAPPSPSTPRAEADCGGGERRHPTPRECRGDRAQRGRAGVGRLKLTLSDDDTWPPDLVGARHHIGTTRMHPDPKRGVVDANGRVHGIQNLFVAGSSVFPTVGSANPTLTIVALAPRLADHVKERFA